MADKHHYSDNTLVTEDGEDTEFLCIGEREDADEPAFIYRYAVPGRYDIYGFGLRKDEPYRSSRVTYWSASPSAIQPARVMLLKDLEHPRVIEMFREFANAARFPRRMLRLLDTLAPDSSAVNAYRMTWEERMRYLKATRDAIIATERERVKAERVAEDARVASDFVDET
jgi:hypothetical protein